MDGHLLCEYAARTTQLDGAVVEFGVYRGKSAELLQQIFVGKEVHLFDSFEGLPEPLPIDGEPKGKFKADQELVRSRLNSHAYWHVGWFADTVQTADIQRIIFAHLDCDHYQSYNDCIPFVMERLVPGGVIVMDDYGFAKCKGATKAIDEHFKGKRGFQPKGCGAVYQRA